jgi:serine/threonine-protein phosphatase 2A activator
MIKMYNAEVLSKFPVVQHFPFGSLFSWEQDPSATTVTQTVHTANHPISKSTASNAPTVMPSPQEGTKPPWATQPAPEDMPLTTAPWAKPLSGVPQTGMPPTRAPWASNNRPGTTGQVPIGSAPHGLPDGPTRAPWADQGGSGKR